MVQILQSKNTGWLDGLKKKTCLYAAYKRLTNTEAENEGIETDIPCTCNEKKAGVAILT